MSSFVDPPLASLSILLLLGLLVLVAWVARRKRRIESPSEQRERLRHDFWGFL